MKSALAALVATLCVLTLAGCGGDEARQLPAPARPTMGPTPDRSGPPPATAEGLPESWFVAESDGISMTLKRFDDEDAWIWVSAKRMRSAGDLDRYVAEHRESVESPSEAEYRGSGTVDTAKRGASRWSWGTYVEKDDDGERLRHELVLFVPFEHRDLALELVYVYPGGGAEHPDRLQELVAVADGLESGS